MSNFKVGQKVVCIRETISKNIKLNEIYTITGLFDDSTGVTLKEVNPSPGYHVFYSSYFRPLDHAFADEVEAMIKEQVKQGELETV